MVTGWSVVMATLHVRIKNSVEDDFRKHAKAKFKVKYGYLKVAMEEAINMWVANNPIKEKKTQHEERLANQPMLD